MPAMQGSVGICTCTVVTLSIRRKERYLPTLYHTLLQTGDAGTDERNHEMGRAKNVVISSGSGYPAFVAGIYQEEIKIHHKLHEYSQIKKKSFIETSLLNL